MHTLSGPEILSSNGKSLVILLHGLGASGNDLIAIGYHMKKFLPNTHFIAPNAPFPYDMAPFGCQWFSMIDRSHNALLGGLKKAADIVKGYVNKQLERFNLSSANLALVGFSQGAALALYAGFSSKQPCAAILSFSGLLVMPDVIESKPPVCLIHGEDDKVVPFTAFTEAHQLLSRYNIKFRAFSRKGLAHEIDPPGMRIGASFLEDNLK